MTISAAIFPFTVNIEVAFRDLDVLGHVNNAVYLAYMDTARIKYFFHLLNLTSLSRVPVIMAEVTCTYKSPALYGEQLTIGVGISRFGSKSFDMIYRIDAGDGRLVAHAKTTQVMYDYETASTITVPESFKTRVHDFQGDWQAS